LALTREPNAYQWALPEKLEVPPDELKCRLDFYQDTIILYLLDKGVINTRVVSARDITMALLREVPLRSEILPVNTLWWGQGKKGVEIALWVPPRVWPVAVVTKPLEPPRRFRIPMPGLIFICSSGKPPWVYAAKKRPVSPRDSIYHAPLFNIFHNGSTCSGTHKYPEQIEEIPNSFFTSFFSLEANYNGRSKKHPDSLLKLWEELDGQKRYPLKDLIRAGKVEDITP